MHAVHNKEAQRNEEGRDPAMSFLQQGRTRTVEGLRVGFGALGAPGGWGKMRVRLGETGVRTGALSWLVTVVPMASRAPGLSDLVDGVARAILFLGLLLSRTQ